MDAQPDVGKLAEAFTTSSTALAAASREIALVVNLPTFNHGQRIFEAIERLTTSIDDLRTDVITMRTDIRTLRTDMNSKFENLELRMSADASNHTARVYNSHISSRETPLRALNDQRNMAVEGFPRDSASLMRLSGNALSTLLEKFQLSTDGTLETKRKRLREFVGLVIDA